MDQLQARSERVAEVLQLVIQHCPALTNGSTRSLANLLLINQTCRRAVQASLGHYHLRSWHVDTLEGWAQFCSWLVSHAGLVSVIDLDEDSFSEQHSRAAEQLLVFALSACCQHGPPPGGLPAAAPAPLQLRSLAATFIQSAAALQPLAACSTLTSLHLVRVPCSSLTAGFCTALGALKSLKQLHCRVVTEQDNLPATFAAALHSLQQLTLLHIDAAVPLAMLPQLPAGLQELKFSVAPAQAPAVLDLTQLTRLNELELNAPGGTAAASLLPAALTALSLFGPAEALHGVPQLQRLVCHRPSSCMGLLRSLPDRSSVQQLCVGLWGCPMGDMHRVMGAVSRATQLTQLAMHKKMSGTEYDDDNDPQLLGELRLHAHLTKLRALQHLEVWSLDVQASDALQFTALSALTALYFCSTPHVDDLAVAAIACTLARLQKLVLWSCDLVSPALWPALGTATQLVHLQLGACAPPLLDDSLWLLLPLQQLTYLVVGGQSDESVTDQAWRDFKHAMPVLKKFEIY